MLRTTIAASAVNFHYANEFVNGKLVPAIFEWLETVNRT